MEEVVPQKRARAVGPPLRLFVYSVETVVTRSGGEIRCFGRGERGESALLVVTGFKHRFYVNAVHVDREVGRIVTTTSLEDYVRTHGFARRRSYNLFASLQLVHREDVMFFKPPQHPPTSVYEVSLTAWSDLRAVAKVFSDRHVQTWEADGIPHELRFMVDIGLRGCSWLEVDTGTFVERGTATSCDHEYAVDASRIRPLEPEGPWSAIPRLSILSFDIECR